MPPAATAERDAMCAERHDGRRRFMGQAAMALAAAPWGLLSSSEAQEREPRHLAAFRGATEWLHAPPQTAANWTGRVVLVQFGTYTCINWLRTLPYVRSWAHHYRPGLTVVGVHTPEFAFERRLDNVRRAVAQLALPFPIAIDNDQAIWRAFDNHYWPALYLLDGRGRRRAEQFGEGDYERTERRIRELLAEAGGDVNTAPAPRVAARGIELQPDWSRLQSPEMYLGARRAAHFWSLGGVPPGRHGHSAPRRLSLNQWALAGEWTAGDESLQTHQAPGRLACRFQARDVHLVMGPQRADVPVRFLVSLDGQPPGASRGLDVNDVGEGTLAEQRLYQLVRQPGTVEARTVAVEFLEPGAEVFAFTFG